VSLYIGAFNIFGFKAVITLVKFHLFFCFRSRTYSYYRNSRCASSRRCEPPDLCPFDVLIMLSEVLSELHRAQESAYNLRDIARQDHIARAKICSKIIKYPNVQDYPVCSSTTGYSISRVNLPNLSQLALREHDEKQLYLARQHLFDLRNVYAVVTDIIHKNIAKASAMTLLLDGRYS
jgi:hypothetical protein